MRSVLITGASTGIGEGCALRLTELGYRVFAGIRRPADGERLNDATGGRARVVELDVTQADQVARAAETIAAELGPAGLDGLVNNAGVGVGGPLEYLPLDQLRYQFEVNVVGLLAVTQAVLPLLRLARGRIVNIGSIAGLSVTPFAGPYCASKYAVEAVTDALRLELAPFGIRVSVIEPGPIRTRIWEKGTAQLEAALREYSPEVLDRYGDDLRFFGKVLELNANHGVSPDAVVDVVVEALEADPPATRYLVGRDAKLRALLRRFLPDRANDALLRYVLGRMRKRLR